jgi:hypothetical protein
MNVLTRFRKATTQNARDRSTHLLVAVSIRLPAAPFSFLKFNHRLGTVACPEIHGSPKSTVRAHMPECIWIYSGAKPGRDNNTEKNETL